MDSLPLLAFGVALLLLAWLARFRSRSLLDEPADLPLRRFERQADREMDRLAARVFRSVISPLSAIAGLAIVVWAIVRTI
jgi:hypothetical protein